MAALVVACGGNDPSPGADDSAAGDDPGGPVPSGEDPRDISLSDTLSGQGEVPGVAGSTYITDNSVSLRVGLPLAAPGAVLDAEALVIQLEGYDPGSLLRCELSGQAAYDSAIDAIGGVTWGYGVQPLEDQSKPRFLAGFQNIQRWAVPGATADGAAPPPVEIVLPDIVAVTDVAALFYSRAHGLMVVEIA